MQISRIDESDDPSLDKNFDQTFHSSIGTICMIVQFFGILPVNGVRSHDALDLQFNWFSLRTIHAIIVITSLSAYTSLVFWRTFTKPLELGTINILIFYLMNTMGYIIFFIIARKWPALMRYWQEIELQLPPFRAPNEKRRKMFCLKIFALGLLAGSLCKSFLLVKF